MRNIASSLPGTAESGGKKSLKERAVRELERYAIITVYLWLLIALLSLHKQAVQGHGISLWLQGFAIVNALVLGKVILIGQALEVGKGLERRALVWVVLGKSLVFVILLVAFHVAEEAIRTWFESKPLSDAFAGFGGTLAGLLTYAGIFFIALIPFFAFQEASRILGSDALWGLYFRSGERRFRLVEEIRGSRAETDSPKRWTPTEDG
jgi:hypothetical protein